jgi:hypothetical protein
VCSEAVPLVTVVETVTCSLLGARGGLKKVDAVVVAAKTRVRSLKGPIIENWLLLIGSFEIELVVYWRSLVVQL